MSAGQHRIEIGQVAEQGIHVAIVADVVTEVLHRRREERREPDPVHAQAGDIVQLFEHTLQIADAVAVGVEKTAGIDLIDYSAPPPRGVAPHPLPRGAAFFHQVLPPRHAMAPLWR